MNEVLNINEVTRNDYFKESHGKTVVEMTLKAALELGDNLFYPIFEEMDRKVPLFEKDNVVVHDKVKEIMKECGEGGWIAASLPVQYGGFQMPRMLHLSCRFILSAANYSAGVFPNLTTGAARLIVKFGNDWMKKTYLPKMVKGQWQGTMALTEPEAGSSLADLKTTAELDSSGNFYNISGQKIFISAGDHDGVKNIVHMLLAKIPGSPPGVKGISLFLVPKLRVNEEGNLESNDVITAEVYHKLGYRGCPITKLNFGENNNCRGYLVGEANKGLSHMFQLVNESRISVGIGSAAIASAAYHAALEYTQQRKQGRPLGEKNPLNPPVEIIEHLDIKRMLLYQKSIIEGSLSLLLYGAKCADLEEVSNGADKERWKYLLEILTPIFKAYPSEKGIICVSNALQCFGGYGYCEDFPVEQLYRDIRIHPLHEGTTGIQALDLLGRKVSYKNGIAFQIFCEEVEKSIETALSFNELKDFSKDLQAGLDRLKLVTRELLEQAVSKQAKAWIADATLYLEMFGTVAIAWQWLLQGPAIISGLKKSNKKEFNFFQGKLFALMFFFKYELNNIYSIERRLLNEDDLLISLKKEYLN